MQYKPFLKVPTIEHYKRALRSFPFGFVWAPTNNATIETISHKDVPLMSFDSVADLDKVGRYELLLPQLSVNDNRSFIIGGVYDKESSRQRSGKRKTDGRLCMSYSFEMGGDRGVQQPVKKSCIRMDFIPTPTSKFDQLNIRQGKSPKIDILSRSGLQKNARPAAAGTIDVNSAARPTNFQKFDAFNSSPQSASGNDLLPSASCSRRSLNESTFGEQPKMDDSILPRRETSRDDNQDFRPLERDMDVLPVQPHWSNKSPIVQPGTAMLISTIEASQFEFTVEADDFVFYKELMSMDEQQLLTAESFSQRGSSKYRKVKPLYYLPWVRMAREGLHNQINYRSMFNACTVQDKTRYKPDDRVEFDNSDIFDFIVPAMTVISQIPVTRSADPAYNNPVFVRDAYSSFELKSERRDQYFRQVFSNPKWPYLSNVANNGAFCFNLISTFVQRNYVMIFHPNDPKTFSTRGVYRIRKFLSTADVSFDNDIPFEYPLENGWKFMPLKEANTRNILPEITESENLLQI